MFSYFSSKRNNTPKHFSIRFPCEMAQEKWHNFDLSYVWDNLSKILTTPGTVGLHVQNFCTGIVRGLLHLHNWYILLGWQVYPAITDRYNRHLTSKADESLQSTYHCLRSLLNTFQTRSHVPTFSFCLHRISTYLLLIIFLLLTFKWYPVHFITSWLVQNIKYYFYGVVLPLI